MDSIKIKFMILIVSICESINTNTGLPHYNQPLMVNGEAVSGSDYPWMASLRADYPNHVFADDRSVDFYNRFCGGSLISTNPICIMTAAHCVDFIDHNGQSFTHSGDAINFFIDLGRTKGPFLHNTYDESNDDWITLTVNDPDSIKIHPQWDASEVGKGHDIALIIIDDGQTLPSDYPFGRIPPQMSISNECCQPNDLFTAIGYGLDDDKKQGGEPTNTLDKITMTYQEASSPSCGNPNNLVCVLGNRNALTEQDTCSGDSGGPLFKTSEDGEITIIGLTSYGISMTDDFCNSANQLSAPSFFTSCGHFRDWIETFITAPLPKTGNETTPTASPTLTPQPALDPTPKPTLDPIADATPIPTARPTTADPTPDPTAKPTLGPTPKPTMYDDLIVIAALYIIAALMKALRR